MQPRNKSYANSDEHYPEDVKFFILEPIFREKSLMLLTNKIPPKIEKRQ